MTRTTHIEEKGGAPANAVRTRERARQKRRGVLIVEDERDVAELMRYHVMKEGYEATVASRGIDGIRLAKEFQPNLVLLDIIVPELNGWEICRRLKRDRETAGIPVVMVTGRVEEGDKVLGLEMGADDYITKPFSPRELVARIRAVRRRSVSTRTFVQRTHLKNGRSS
jgi:DNA-binding response OmpR family regulator